jgi:hypothetical protein
MDLIAIRHAPMVFSPRSLLRVSIKLDVDRTALKRTIYWRQSENQIIVQK